MKKFFTVALLVFATIQLGAQSKEVNALLKNYAKSQTEIADAKKAANPAVWTKYAKILTDAYSLPTNSLWVGLSSLEAKVILKDQKALSTESKTIQGEAFEVVKYADKDLYYNAEGKLSFWLVTKPIIPNVDLLGEAYKAYLKATELDDKGAQKKAIQDGLNTIATAYVNEAMSDYTLGNFATASTSFEKSYLCSSQPAVSNVDTTIVYYAGLTAHMAEDYERSSAFFQKCLDMGFGQDGDAYANLADAAKKLGDIDKCKAVLAEGFTKYPNSQSILVALINSYLESNDDPNKVLEFIHKAQQNEANNPSLYYAEGNVLKNLGKFDEALALYEKSVSIDPNFFFGHFQKGQAYYDKAVEIQTAAADELDDAKYLKMVEELDSSLAKSIEPFEKALAVTEEAEYKDLVVEYLKNVFFRLRSKSPEYEANYNKYNKMYLGEE